MRLAIAGVGAMALAIACGESRRPIGDACIRDEDCLSDVCAARLCASQPPRATAANNPPDPEAPRIPDDAGTLGGDR